MTGNLCQSFVVPGRSRHCRLSLPAATPEGIAVNRSESTRGAKGSRTVRAVNGVWLDY